MIFSCIYRFYSSTTSNPKKIRKTIEQFAVTVIPLDACSLDKPTGAKSQPAVYKGIYHHSKGVTFDVTFKEYRKPNNRKLTPKDYTEICKEVKLLKNLECNPNIVRIIGVTFKAQLPILVVELGNETLESYLCERRLHGDTLSWYVKTKLCLDITRGLKGLHAAGIVHGGLKGDSILVFENPTEKIPIAKIKDFGYSSALMTFDEQASGMKYALAPECMPQHTKLASFRKEATQDIYNLGLVIYQIAANDAMPSKSESAESQLPVQLMQIPKDTPGELLYIVVKTMWFTPTHRIPLEIVEQKLQELLAHQSAKEQPPAYTQISETNSDRKLAALTPLTFYTAASNYDMNVNVTDCIGRIALHLAAERGDDDIVKTLLDVPGVDVGFKNLDGQTALHIAAEKGHANMVKTLISDLGADVNSRDMNGQTPLHLAAKMGHINVLKVLTGEDRGKSLRRTASLTNGNAST